MHLLLSCEHASKRVPAELAPLFAGHQAVLDSHRGVDIGALRLAHCLAKTCAAPLHTAYVSRLVVDLNRSQGHPHCLSEMTRTLSFEAQALLLARYYTPYRRALAAHIARLGSRGATVVHVGVHSFTPVWKQQVRRVDIGLLFDPQRAAEARLCRAWQAELQRRRPQWRIRRNNPYRGTADGLTTTLRRRLAAKRYLGIELEMNQALAHGTAQQVAARQQDIADALRAIWRRFKQTQRNAQGPG